MAWCWHGVGLNKPLFLQRCLQRLITFFLKLCANSPALLGFCSLQVSNRQKSKKCLWAGYSPLRKKVSVIHHSKNLSATLAISVVCTSLKYILKKIISEGYLAYTLLVGFMCCRCKMQPKSQGLGISLSFKIWTWFTKGKWDSFWK